MTAVYITAAIVVVFVIAVALRPGTFVITRSTTISAPPSAVFGLVNDLHIFQEWSPWAKKDPNGKISFDGPQAGPGASFAWAGNRDVGEGRMTVTESHASDLVRLKLEFIKPFSAVNAVEFTFKPQGPQTVVTWTMSGTNNFAMKAFGLFMNCDKMIGADFEKGLANMKSLAESAVAQK